MKYVKCLNSNSIEDLETQINAVMKNDEKWNLITIDNQPANHLGIQQMIYRAWLQYNA